MRPDNAGEIELRRKKLQKSVTALAAVLAGAGTALVATAPAAAASSELKLAAGDDAYVSSGRKGANFGGEDKLSIGRLDGDTQIGFLKFVVPAGTEGVNAGYLRSGRSISVSTSRRQYRFTGPSVW